MADRPVSKKNRRKSRIIRLGLTGFFLLVFFFVAYWMLYENKPELVPEPYRPTSARDAYHHALVEAGLDQTALGRDWLDIGEKVLADPIEIGLPYEEIFYMDAGLANAIAFEFDVRRGRRIEAALTLEAARPLLLPGASPAPV